MVKETKHELEQTDFADTILTTWTTTVNLQGSSLTRECGTRFSTSSLFHDSNPSGPLINMLKYFRIEFRLRRDIRSQSSKISTPWCSSNCGVKILVLANKIFFLQTYSYMIELFTPKRISPECPFKGTQRLVKILILTPRCAFWLYGVMHTAKLDFVVWSTPWSLTQRCDAHHGVWLRGGKHTGESDSAVGCTQWSSTPLWDAHCRVRLTRKCPFFLFSYLLHLLTSFFRKTFELKKIPWTICDL